MSNCKNCLFWEPKNEFNKTGECGELTEKGWIANDGLNMEYIPDGQRNSVLTGPNFGCIHGRDKVTKEAFIIGQTIHIKDCALHKYKITKSKIGGIAVWQCEVCNHITTSN